MSKNYSINIKDFTGIHKAMAEKANVNGGNTLDNTEISIFNEILSTYNVKDDTFIVENIQYDKNGRAIDTPQYEKAEAVSTMLYKTPNPQDFEAGLKNVNTVQKAKEYAKELENMQDKPVKVVRYVNGEKVTFTYKRSDIENYIINDAVDSKGNPIKYFSKIPEIRNKSIALRTKEESRLLVEFNNMINSVIKAGSDYAVDPKLIVAIIQQEVGFDGLSKKVTGVNGKGYMQITSIAVKDMLGAYSKNKKLYYEKNFRTKVYGKEIISLLKSRGFDTDCPPEKRKELAKKIMAYLKQNNDGDFNIRLGTLLLRSRLNASNGDVQKAAQNYNGNSKNGIKYAYGKTVSKNYNKMNNIA